MPDCRFSIYTSPISFLISPSIFFLLSFLLSPFSFLILLLVVREIARLHIVDIMLHSTGDLFVQV